MGRGERRKCASAVVSYSVLTRIILTAAHIHLEQRLFAGQRLFHAYPLGPGEGTPVFLLGGTGGGAPQIGKPVSIGSKRAHARG
jgi:hypothetical protein